MTDTDPLSPAQQEGIAIVESLPDYPETTTPQTQTPISDKAAREGAYFDGDDYTSTGGKQIVHIKTARQLETELVTLQAEYAAAISRMEQVLVEELDVAFHSGVTHEGCLEAVRAHLISAARGTTP